MRLLPRRSIAALIATMALVGPLAPAPGFAATAEEGAAGTFIQTLADQVFGLLRAQGSTDAARDQRFRQMLRDNFAIRQIGDRLIRRQRSTLTAAQYGAYTAAFPDFVIKTYSDRLEQYRDARFKVVRTLDRGRAGIDVVSRVTRPGGGDSFEAVWNVRRNPAGKLEIVNLTVAGINLALTQEADFAAYIQRNGFDALVTFMRGAGAPRAAGSAA